MLQSIVHPSSFMLKSRFDPLKLTFFWTVVSTMFGVMSPDTWGFRGDPPLHGHISPKPCSGDGFVLLDAWRSPGSSPKWPGVTFEEPKAIVRELLTPVHSLTLACMRYSFSFSHVWHRDLFCGARTLGSKLTVQPYVKITMPWSDEVLVFCKTLGFHCKVKNKWLLCYVTVSSPIRMKETQLLTCFFRASNR